MSELISSAANQLAKQIRRLGDRKHRRQAGLFVVEGIQPVWRAVELGWVVDTLVLAPELAPDRAAQLVAEQEAAGVPVARLSAELFTRLSDREGPSGLMAVVRSRALSLEDIDVHPDAVLVVLERVANPGNLGTIIRTADAAGVAGVILIGESTDPFGPAAVKASMGSVFGVPVVPVRDGAQFLAWAGAHGIQVVAATGSATRDHWSVSYRRPAAILLGSEREGLSDDLVRAADLGVRIPMTGTAESLNLAVAAAVVVYEVVRHRLD